MLLLMIAKFSLTAVIMMGFQTTTFIVSESNSTFPITISKLAGTVTELDLQVQVARVSSGREAENGQYTPSSLN